MSSAMNIPNDVARLWVENYQNGIAQTLKPLSHDPMQGETKSMWYPIQGFKEMTDDLVNRGATGVRIYFAQYSEQATLPGEVIPPNAGGNLTLVFTGTTKNQEGMEEDFGYNEIENLDDFFDFGTPCPPLKCDGLKFPG